MKLSIFIVFILAFGLTNTSAASDCEAEYQALADQMVAYGHKAASTKAKQVFDLCRREVDSGSDQAKLYLAFFYLPGHGGTTPNLAEGIRLIRDAADKGVARAQWWLGWQHEEGGFLPKDDVAALSWYQKAAESDDTNALLYLAHAYENGRLGLSVDTLKAKELRARANRCASARRQSKEGDNAKTSCG